MEHTIENNPINKLQLQPFKSEQCWSFKMRVSDYTRSRRKPNRVSGITKRVSLSSKGDLVHLFSVRHIYEYLQYEYLITVSIQESPNLQILHYEFCPIITLVSDSPSDIPPPPGQSRSPPPRRPRL